MQQSSYQMKGFFLLFFIACLPLGASSVKLYNDSPYPLQAVIQAADGSKMGEVLVQPNVLMIWNSENAMAGYHQTTGSESPFTILWYCTEGEPYSVCSLVGNATMVTAQSCAGTRQCKTPPKKPLEGTQQQEPQVEFAPPSMGPSAPPATMPGQGGFSEYSGP